MIRSLSSRVLLAVAWLSVCVQVAHALPALPHLPYNAPNPMRDKPTVVSGLNNYNCRPSRAHPRAVVLVHSTLLTEESWHPLFAPALVKSGYCVFALTYGRQEGVPFFAGVNDLEGSARELSHLVTLGEALGLLKPFEPVVDSFCKGCYDMITDSPFMQKLNAGGDTTPGVIHSYIATRYDEVITPYESTFTRSPGVTNVLLQDLCGVSFPEHLLMLGSKVVVRWMLNQLDPNNARTANCLSVFDWY
ncbi:hypothetical protein BGZ70_005483 [Mortierella alpina]|uniref:Triacylglycerol lipase n=1 Tax=Mortierella alpina TaxID=64518 RepID=A0A9P6J8S2_MORAP|nr:hypothetical protein BGZ70_005483 [Mortierella alpina]